MGLPEDVIVDLLSRLPVKSLLRLRCVSKQWLNLISSSSSSSSPLSVKNLHDHGNHSNPFLLVWNNNFFPISMAVFLNSIRVRVVDMVGERVHNEFNFAVFGPVFHSVIGCRDLVCFIGKDRVYACNPSTKELVQVPNCDCDDNKNNAQFALGYLPSTKQYKLIRWLRLHVYTPCADECVMRCEIFTITNGGRLNCGSWRVTRNHSCMRLLRYGVCIDGVIYWLLSYYEKKNYDHNLMLSFDLDKEDYEMVLCPEPCPSHERGVGYLLELKGMLCLVHHVYEVDESILIKTWFLKENKDFHDWVVGFRINIGIVHDKIRLQAYNSVDDNGEELVFMSSGEEGALYYNIRTQSFRRPELLQHVTRDSLKWPIRYFDSFFSLESV